MCGALKKLSSSYKVKILCAITLSNTFYSLLSNAMGHRALGSEQSPLSNFLRETVLQWQLWWGGKSNTHRHRRSMDGHGPGQAEFDPP